MDNKIKNQKIGSKKYSFPSRGRWCEAPDEVCKKGISLISLIITIIVIIILAAIVIFSGFDTTESAGFAKFAQEISGYRDEIQDEYRKQRIQNSVENNAVNDQEVYSQLGEERGDTASLIQGKNLSATLIGENAYKLEKEKKLYSNETGVYVTDKGEVFSLPGYRYVTNNETRYYINESTYYTGEPMESVDAISVVSIYGADTSATAWNFLSEASSLISSDSSINNRSMSAIFTKDDKPYVIRAGDEFSVSYAGRTEPVIVLGFNYDDKADGTGKAGITFGFKNILKTCELADLITDYSLPLFGVVSECEDMLSDISEATRGNILQVTKNTTLNTHEDVSEVSTDNYLWSLDDDELLPKFNKSYAYYTARWDVSENNSFASKSYNGTPTDFWLRGSNLSQNATKATVAMCWFSNEFMSTIARYYFLNISRPMEKTLVKEIAPDALGLAPCFCI